MMNLLVVSIRFLRKEKTYTRILGSVRDLTIYEITPLREFIG